jgi:hypothetical protein
MQQSHRFSLKIVRQFHYEGEGWGMKRTANELITSDGMAILAIGWMSACFLSGATFYPIDSCCRITAISTNSASPLARFSVIWFKLTVFGSTNKSTESTSCPSERRPTSQRERVPTFRVR